MQEKRSALKQAQPEMNISKLVFLDESGINTNMTRLYGRSIGGERVIDSVPDARYESMTILSSVRLNGEIVPLVIDGALNGELFKGYISECLLPTLTRGDIVVMDNLSCHKVKGVREAIESVGASVLYLPPYSPDFNPIELMWSKTKSYLRKAKARTKKLLEQTLAEALKTITSSDIFGWFSKCGYSTQ